MSNKETYKPVQSNYHQNKWKKLTIAFDFDDCLKNVQTKKPIEAVVKVMLQYYNNEHHVIIVTARGKIGIPEIEDFLKKYELQGKIPIYTTGDNIDRRKSPIICEKDVDIFFDDQPGFLEDVARHCPKVQLFQTFPNNDISIKPYPSTRKRSRE